MPPLAGQFINLIKDSSLVSVISITDLTKAGREVVSSTFSPFEVWFTVALLYLVLTGTLSFLVRRLEVKYAQAATDPVIKAQQVSKNGAITGTPCPFLVASSGGEICAQQLIPLSRLNRSREVQPSPARPAPSRCVVWR